MMWSAKGTSRAANSEGTRDCTKARAGSVLRVLLRSAKGTSRAANSEGTRDCTKARAGSVLRVFLGRFALVFIPWMLAAQPAEMVSTQIFEIRGTVQAVQLVQGQGMPTLTVEEKGRRWKVWLGSMRYLIDQNFTPKTGQGVLVEAFPCKANGEALAAAVTLAGGKRLPLRDPDGRPVWRGRGLGKGAR